MKLQDIRENAKLTITQVAKLTHLDPRTIKTLEAQDTSHTHRKSVRKATLTKYLRACGCSQEAIEKEIQKRIIVPTVGLDPWLIEVLNAAIEQHASDIHIERSRVRFRIDGELTLTKFNAPERFINQYPQDELHDFAFRHSHENNTYDVRGCVAAQHYTYRLLQHGGIPKLEEIFVDKHQYHAVLPALQRKQGLILLSGPTGSGKTTMGLALLNKLDKTANSIYTVEDPVELEIEGICQLKLDPAHNDFPTIIRQLLRADPDVIYISDIRCGDTARMAINAARTGRLVIAGLHAANASSALNRLTQLGVSVNDIRENVILSINQRLVRKNPTGRFAVVELVEPGSTHRVITKFEDTLNTAVKNGLITEEQKCRILQETTS